ncbi:MAG TPA: hypothetical protein VJN93_06820 [Candidatus Acidoferrum sp.]|nr:hypothetical protein [Candidatus Acidoferrum sp.]
MPAPTLEKLGGNRCLGKSGRERPVRPCNRRVRYAWRPIAAPGSSESVIAIVWPGAMPFDHQRVGTEGRSDHLLVFTLAASILFATWVLLRLPCSSVEPQNQ